MLSQMRRGAAAALLVAVLAPTTAIAQIDFSLLDFYRDEIAKTGDSPGVSRSVVAGRTNPAAWQILQRPGLYFSYEDFAGPNAADDYAGVLSLKNLGFSARHVSRDGEGATDMTVGLGFGNRSVSTGIAYGWRRGDDELLGGDSERLVSGGIWRNRWGSLGITNVYDFESEETLDHYDLGLRPFGPRWTLFADYIGWRSSESGFGFFDYDEDVFGYGVELNLMPGLAIGVRGDDGQQFGLRLSLAWDSMRPSATYRLNDDGDRIGTNYAVEFTEGPNLRKALAPHEEFRELHLKGAVAYRNYKWFDDRRKFSTLLAEVNSYAEDTDVTGVVLNLSGLRMTPANLWELRAQLAGLRAHGKRVVVYFDRLDSFGYMMASVADELWMDPMGEIDLGGLAFGRSYYKRMLDKIGIGFDEWRFFDYKSAAEPFARTEMSEGEREQITKVMEDFWEENVASIVEARGLERSELDRIMNDYVRVRATEAEELGLVDAIGDFHELREDAENTRRRPGEDSDVAALGPAFGDPVWRQEEWGEAPRIAVLYAIGPCSMDSGIRGRELSKFIRTVREDPSIKAVVLRADSPGGDPLPSDLVARELKKTSEVKPVIVSQGQVAASGGYWISMYGDEILASPYTITGSIGVISGHVYDNGIADKMGIDFDHVQIGKSSDVQRGPALPLVDVSIPHRPVTAEERARAEESILALYDEFTEAVAEGRGLTKERVHEIGQGRIWAGLDGREIGLVDEIGGLWQAILVAKQSAGIPLEARVQLVEGPQLGSLPPWILQPKLIAADLRGLFGGASSPLAGTGLDGAGLVADHAGDAPFPAILEGIVDPAQWEKLDVSERAYLEQVFSRPAEPMVLMEPLDLGIDD